jgi:hypothetical protein
MPVLAGRYWLTDEIGIEGLTGFKISSKDSDRINSFVLGGKLLRIIKSYSNLNVVVATTLSINRTNDSRCVHGSSKSNSKFSLQTCLAFIVSFGLEWFVLDNLSLSAEAGLCRRYS